MYNAVYPHVAPYLTDWQHGFVRGRSWAAQLVLSHHQCLKALNERTLFSWTLQRHLTEWHLISCRKRLRNFGISGALLNWCKDFLSDREQRVVIEGMNSTWCALPSGGSQGSLLGPLFFVIFISDMPEVVMARNCVIICWRLQNIQDYKLSSWLFCISVRSRQFICMESTKPHGV